MHVLKTFTYPTFMGLCTILAACADVLQNQTIFNGVLMALLFVAALAALLSVKGIAGAVLERPATEQSLKTFGVDPSIKTSMAPFAISCIILAGIIYVFSAASSKASEEGGVLVVVFPDLRPIQLSLGRIEQNVGMLKQQTVAIKQDTGQLVDTVVKWISLDVSLGSNQRMTNAGEKHYFPQGMYVTFTNETGRTFEDVTLLVTDGTNALISENVKIFPQDGYKHNSYDDGKAYEKISVCLSAKRRNSDEWLQENRVYQSKQLRLTDEPIFELVDASGQRVLKQKPTCSI